MDETWLSAALASDATGGKGVLPLWIRTLRPGVRLIGAVTTCQVDKDDNLAVRKALEAGATTGPILLVAGAFESTAGVMGGLVAEALSMNGFRGVVTDGLIRDSGEVVEFLKVWARGVTPKAPGKQGPPTVGEPVVIGGVTVAPGDLLVCDDDGVVACPAAAVAALRTKALERDARDQARGALLRRTGRLGD